MRTLSKHCAAAAVLMCGQIFGVVAWAKASELDRTVNFSIDAQSLEKALVVFSQQADIQVVLNTSALPNTEAPALRGTVSARAALSELLKGTGLQYASVGNRTVSVTQAQATDARSDENANGGPPSSSLEEIIVTAQKREERLINVPISIVAMGSGEMQRRKVNSIDDLPAAVPGLTIQGSGGFIRRIMLRGISNTFGGSSLIGMYLDEAAVTGGSAAGLDLRTYDLERIEVLRGPQGTLYGDGSVGGTIRFITENPKLDRFAAKSNIAASFTEDGEPSQRIEGVVNVPLIDDELGLRIAGTFDRQGGWMDQPALGKKDINDQEVAHVRVKGLWQPTPEFTVNAMAVIHRNDGSLGSKSEDADGNYTQIFDLPTTPSAQDDYTIYNLTLTYDFSAVRLLSATSFVDVDKAAKDFGSVAQIVAPPGPRRRAYYFLNASDSSVLSEEIRFTSQGEGPWQWTAGGFYRKAETESPFIYTLDGVFPTQFFLRASSESTSGAVFGDTSYQLTARMKLGAGLRYFEDDQEAQSGVGVVVPATLGPLQKASFHSLNPRLYLQYKWTDQLNTYASAAKGFRSGGFNQLNQPPYDPESVWTYELGTKIALANARVTGDVALFHSDYTDYQVAGLVPTPPVGALLARISNAGDVRIRGIDLGFTWHPADRWSLSFNSTYAESEFVEIDALNAPFVVGDALDLVPKYSYSVSAEREWTWNARPGFVRLDYSQQGRTTYRNRNLVGPTPWHFGKSDVINQLNLNTSVQWNERLSLGFFAENLLNDRDYSSAFAYPDDTATRPRPRTFGIQFGVNFD